MHITEVLRVSAQAWKKVKPAEDPDFNNCALSHREYLIAHTEGVIRTGSATTDYEKAVKEILDSELKAPETQEEAKAPADKPKKANGAKK